jgi:hypothetical protein
MFLLLGKGEIKRGSINPSQPPLDKGREFLNTS